VRTVSYTREALKQLRRIPANTARLITDKVDQYAEDPASLANNVTQLRGRPGWRLRVGDWRVIFMETEQSVEVQLIRPRGSAYDYEDRLGAVTKFKTPSGDEMVIIPATDYARLIDAAQMTEDVAAFDRVREAVARGREDLLPATFVARILSGESPVAVWRTYRGLSLEMLAERSGLPVADLTKVEAGDVRPEPRVLAAIAAALSVDADDLE